MTWNKPSDVDFSSPEILALGLLGEFPPKEWLSESDGCSSPFLKHWLDERAMPAWLIHDWAYKKIRELKALRKKLKISLRVQISPYAYASAKARMKALKAETKILRIEADAYMKHNIKACMGHTPLAWLVSRRITGAVRRWGIFATRPKENTSG